MDAGEYDMADLLSLLITERAEALSVTPGQAPSVHARGEAYLIEGPAVSPEHAWSLLRCVTNTRQMRQLREHGRAEFLFNFRKTARFRVTARSERDEVQFQIHRMA